MYRNQAYLAQGTLPPTSDEVIYAEQETYYLEDWQLAATETRKSLTESDMRHYQGRCLKATSSPMLYTSFRITLFTKSEMTSSAWYCSIATREGCAAILRLTSFSLRIFLTLSDINPADLAISIVCDSFR
jgi:hypothetical protein